MKWLLRLLGYELGWALSFFVSEFVQFVMGWDKPQVSWHVATFVTAFMMAESARAASVPRQSNPR
jgi:hypothetical protein